VYPPAAKPLPLLQPLLPTDPQLPSAVTDEDSPSVSVSVSSPNRERDAGFAFRLNKRTVASPPSSCEGKWTFFCGGGEGDGDGDPRGGVSEPVEEGGE